MKQVNLKISFKLLLFFKDLAWQGFVQYFQSNGSGDDFWGSKSQDGQWIERNATNLNYLNITIYEPCNFASNLAHYRAAYQVIASFMLLLDDKIQLIIALSDLC